MTDAYYHTVALAYAQREVQLERYPFELEGAMEVWTEEGLEGDTETELACL